MKDEEPMDMLDAWEPQAPPADFAERVLREVRTEPAPKRARWPRLVAAGAAAAIAAAVLLRVSGPPAHGEAIAKERLTVPLGSRALAVLEPAATVKWNGDDVEQSAGDVFYRVEPGARFRVHTPAGDVEVMGTCFRVKLEESKEKDMQRRDLKSAGVGAALTALAMVTVYEGKVAVSHAGQRVELAAGESATTVASGVVAAGGSASAADGEATAPDDPNEDPTVRANRNLVRQVSEYRARLDAIGKQKAEIEAKLHKSEENLNATKDGAPAKSDFDVSPEEWKELAKDGTIKYQAPCMGPQAAQWKPEADDLDALGLSPQDAVPIKDAMSRVGQETWSQVKPLCAAAVGSEALADKIGPSTCIHLVLDIERDKDGAATDRARREVGEIRAGVRPMPAPDAKVHPVTKLFLTMTGSNQRLEHELAQSFGPEEAHRLAYSNRLCHGTSIFGGVKSKK